MHWLLFGSSQFGGPCNFCAIDQFGYKLELATIAGMNNYFMEDLIILELYILFQAMQVGGNAKAVSFLYYCCKYHNLYFE
jgi:hypothetical protein